MMLTRVVLGCVAMAISGHALKLPPYIKPCYRNRPDFSECALKNAAEAVPSIVQGDPKYHIPSLKPLLIDQMTVGTNPGPIDISVEMKNLEVWGLEGVILDSYIVDFDNHVITYNATFPRLEIDSDYNMTGKILILPVAGHGKSNITLENFRYTVNVEFSLTTKPNGKEYMLLGDIRPKTSAERAYFKFENLFNGDKLLGEQMSRVVADNWRDLYKELSPSVEEGLAAVFKSMEQYVFERIPYDEVFPVE